MDDFDDRDVGDTLSARACRNEGRRGSGPLQLRRAPSMMAARSACSTVAGKSREGRRWNEFLVHYHYRGYKTLVGTQMRYSVQNRDGRPVAMLGFSTRVEAGATDSSDGRRKDSDENYLATCKAPETVETGLRPGAVGNFISITVLSAREEPPHRHRQPEVPHPTVDDPHPRLTFLAVRTVAQPRGRTGHVRSGRGTAAAPASPSRCDRTDATGKIGRAAVGRQGYTGTRATRRESAFGLITDNRERLLRR